MKYATWINHLNVYISLLHIATINQPDVKLSIMTMEIVRWDGSLFVRGGETKWKNMVVQGIVTQ